MAEKDFTIKDIQDDRFIVFDVETKLGPDTWKERVPEGVVTEEDLKDFIASKIEQFEAETVKLDDKGQPLEAAVKISEEIDAAVEKPLVAERKVVKGDVGEVVPVDVVAEEAVIR